MVHNLQNTLHFLFLVLSTYNYSYGNSLTVVTIEYTLGDAFLIIASMQYYACAW